ncbi:MAG: LytTR family DNA-binding domain-containing protein [Mucilaginibacter sp.]
MFSFLPNKDKQRAKFYLVYWVTYLLAFSIIQGLPAGDFFTAFRNELISIAPKMLFAVIVVELLMTDLLVNKRIVRFMAVYLGLLIVFAFVLRLIDNFIILKYFLTSWKMEPLTSAPPFLYNAIKLQFLLTIPFCYRLYTHRNKLQQADTTTGMFLNESNFIQVKCDRRMVKVILTEVLYFEAQGNYIFIYTINTVLKAYLSISELEEKLPAVMFVRIHRSFIIALKMAESYTGSYVMIGGKKIPIGRSYQLKAKGSLQMGSKADA